MSYFKEDLFDTCMLCGSVTCYLYPTTRKPDESVYKCCPICYRSLPDIREFGMPEVRDDGLHDDEVRAEPSAPVPPPIDD